MNSIAASTEPPSSPLSRARIGAVASAGSTGGGGRIQPAREFPSNESKMAFIGFHLFS
jgi:hypothetical protein